MGTETVWVLTRMRVTTDLASRVRLAEVQAGLTPPRPRNHGAGAYGPLGAVGGEGGAQACRTFGKTETRKRWPSQGFFTQR